MKAARPKFPDLSLGTRNVRYREAPKLAPMTEEAANLLIPEEAAPQFLDDAAPRNGMMPPPDSEMIAPPITE
jgi:hypothetical protein